ncbi:MAG: DUF3990 domain-containing protein [Defluviitaleaceae bacterium]|nr:DUF3990 domain-containing protein [Defluviitaleaceae bacterium]
MIVYHGGYCEIATPEIRVAKNKKDFGHGFYCTELQTQADKWARRYNTPIVNVYEYTPSAEFDLLRFDTMTDEWLDFIVACRSDRPHNHAIVEGAMANDQVWNYIADFVNGVLTREQFWILAKFKYPTHQIAFCTPTALSCLKFLKSYEVQP